MVSQAASGRVRWAIASGIAIGVMGAFLLLVSGLSPGNPPPLPAGQAEVRPTVKIARPDASDALLKEEAELRDLRPLFLPTARNARLPDPKREPGRTMLDGVDLKSSWSESEVQLGDDLPPVATIGGASASQATPASAFDLETAGVGLPGFGRRPVSLSAVGRSGQFLEVSRWSDGRRVQAEELGGAASPAAERPWNPVEFMAVVDRAGLVSPLIVTAGSGIEEIDQHFRNHLTKTYRIGERLEPGTYRVVVAP